MGFFLINYMHINDCQPVLEKTTRRSITMLTVQQPLLNCTNEFARL